jgi:predicted MFS family arabinose efflux permease
MFGPSALLISGFGVFVHPLSEAFGWSTGQVGYAVSLIALSLTVVSPLQGWLVDRFGARRVILSSIPALAAGLAAMRYLPPSLGTFYLAWVVLTFLAVGVWPGAYLKAVSTWFTRSLGLATGVANAGIGLGVIVVPPLAEAMISTMGWRDAFLGLAGLALLPLPVALLFIHEARLPTTSRNIGRPAGSLPALVGDVNLRLLSLGYFLVGITGTGIVAGLVPLLVTGGMKRGQAVAVMSLFGVSALVARILTGWLLDRFIVSRVMNGFVVLAALAAAAFACGATGPLAVCAAVALGLIMGAEFDVLAYAIRRYFGLGSFGRIYGTVFGIFQLGAATGAGVLATSVEHTHSYRFAMWIFAGALSISVPVFARLRPYRGPLQASFPPQPH